MKILIINSDLAKNRGDRAIAEGVIELIRNTYPSAKITGISEFSDRDKKWFGISFLKMDAQSLKPTDFIRLLKEARKSDLIFWGGGELLKDYTNKTALWYWVMKMWAISMFNKNLYGAYQGIGPTEAASSKRLIRFVVNRCKKFAVRDAESAEKLISWGVKKEKIISSSDPAILPKAKSLDKKEKILLNEDFKIDEKFLKNFICVGPRDWFHYKHGGLIPYRYKKALKSILGIKSENAPNPKHDRYIETLVALAEHISAKGYNILFVPMHMGEEDIALCKYIQKKVSAPNKVRVLDKDIVSPSLLRSVMSHAKIMVGFRLHSTIVATSSSVPSINYYYVDKGRVYFDQIGQAKNASPIEELIENDAIENFSERLQSIASTRRDTSADISARIDLMRKNILSSFKELVGLK